MTFAERVRVGVEAIQVHASAYERVPVSASLGLVSLSNPEVTVEEILRSTHSALYRSKDAGKNRVTFEAAG